MDKQIVVKNVISIPIDFHKTGNMSAVDLLRQSGYLQFQNEITVNDLYSQLKSEPDLIYSWLLWSLDKRTNIGWFILQRKHTYTVGYNNNKAITRKKIFINKYKASAYFISKEIEQISSLLY